MVIAEFLHIRMALERGLHDAALHSMSTSVNQPDVAEARVSGRSDVFLDNRGDVAWREGVQVELGFDRHANGFVGGHARPDLQTCLVYCAVTRVLMPPRTEKSPTTVILRGSSTATRSSRIWLVAAS